MNKREIEFMSNYWLRMALNAVSFHYSNRNTSKDYRKACKHWICAARKERG